MNGGTNVESPTRVRYVVLAFVAAAGFLAYLTRYSLGAVLTTIQAELDLSNAVVVGISAGWSLSYAFFQVPGGWLCDRIGARRLLPVCCVAWCGCVVWTARAVDPDEIWWSRVAFGVAQAPLIPTVTRLLVDWFPPGWRGISSAVFAGSMSVGSVAAFGLTANLLSFGWREVLEAYAAVTVLWAVGFAVGVRNRPEDHPLANAAEVRLIRADPATVPSGSADAAPHAEPLWAFLFRPAMLLLYTEAVCRAAAYAFLGNLLPKYLEEAHHMDPGNAGAWAMLPMAAVAFGTVFGGVLIDAVYRRTGSKRLSRCGVGCASLLLAALFCATALLGLGPAGALVGLGAAAFCFGFSHPATFSTVMDVGGRHTALVMAVLNMAGNVAAYYAPKGMGRLLDLDPGNWVPVVGGVVALFAVGGLAWLGVDPNRTRR
jgi:sugar phosphate permease